MNIAFLRNSSCFIFCSEFSRFVRLDFTSTKTFPINLNEFDKYKIEVSLGNKLFFKFSSSLLYY